MDFWYFGFISLWVFWCKTTSKMTSVAASKACQGQAAAVVWYFHHEMHTGQLYWLFMDLSSLKITFYRFQKCISPIWVGFFTQSIGILLLLYQLLHGIKWFLGLNNWNGPVIPGRIGDVQKTSIWTQPLVKSREIQFF